MRESETISVLKRTQEREIAPGSSIFMLIFGIYSCVVTVLRGCVPIKFFFPDTYGSSMQACWRGICVQHGHITQFGVFMFPKLFMIPISLFDSLGK